MFKNQLLVAWPRLYSSAPTFFHSLSVSHCLSVCLSLSLSLSLFLSLIHTLIISWRLLHLSSPQILSFLVLLSPRSFCLLLLLSPPPSPSLSLPPSCNQVVCPPVFSSSSCLPLTLCCLLQILSSSTESHVTLCRHFVFPRVTNVVSSEKQMTIGTGSSLNMGPSVMVLRKNDVSSLSLSKLPPSSCVVRSCQKISSNREYFDIVLVYEYFVSRLVTGTSWQKLCFPSLGENTYDFSSFFVARVEKKAQLLSTCSGHAISCLDRKSMSSHVMQ